MKATCFKFVAADGMVEPGVDEGGLTAELFSDFWKLLFAKNSDGVSTGFESLFRSSSPELTVFLPKCGHDHSTCECAAGKCRYYDIGRVLLKCVIEMHVLPQRYLPRHVIQYLVSPSQALDHYSPAAPTGDDVQRMLGDMETFDTSYAKSLRNMYEMSGEALGGMTVGDFDGSDSIDPLTDANKAACIVKKIRSVLLDDVRGALDCLRSGFCLERASSTQPLLREPLIDLTPHLALWSADELMDLIYGEEILTADLVKDYLRFDANVVQRSQEHLLRFVGEASESGLRQLLKFMTGSENLASRGNKEQQALKITQVARGRMPAAHTCVRELEVPDEEAYETFRDKLKDSISQGIATGFTDQ
eukprot:g6238.t1